MTEPEILREEADLQRVREADERRRDLRDRQDRERELAEFIPAWKRRRYREGGF